MAAIDFPASPAVGQTFAAPNGVTYKWTGVIWIAQSGSVSAFIGVTPPSNPFVGQLWWCSDGSTGGGQLYIWYDDGNSQQWVPISPTGSLAQGQVAQGQLLDPFSFTTAWVDITSLNVTLTPRSSNSRFKVEVSLGKVSLNATNIGAAFRLTRNGVAIGVGNAAGSRPQISFQTAGIISGDHALGSAFVYLDAPATAAAVTYSVQAQAQSGTCWVNASVTDTNDTNIYHGRGASSLIVTEYP